MKPCLSGEGHIQIWTVYPMRLACARPKMLVGPKLSGWPELMVTFADVADVAPGLVPRPSIPAGDKPIGVGTIEGN